MGYSTKYTTPFRDVDILKIAKDTFNSLLIFRYKIISVIINYRYSED